jgi:hypothetical protein
MLRYTQCLSSSFYHKLPYKLHYNAGFNFSKTAVRNTWESRVTDEALLFVEIDIGDFY